MYPISDPLYDPSNAVLLCDAPHCRAKAYHQRCHFVPVFSIPRGPWVCLLCKYEESLDSRGSKKSQQIWIGQEAPQSKVLGPIIDDDTELLNKFDREAASLKADAISEELSRLTKSLEHSMSNIRSAEHTITFYTNTERLRKELLSCFPRISSEFVHAKVKYSHSKFKIRQQLLSLQHYISDPPSRPEPRFKVGENIQTEAEPSSDPNIILRKRKNLGLQDKTERSSSCVANTVCCVCYGESMLQNKMFLCSGVNCERAFHNNCLRPKPSLSDFKNRSKNWLCPFCSKLSELILYVQQAYSGGHGCDVSWERAENVFPKARMEYQAALLLKERKAPIEALFGESFELKACIDENHTLSRDSDADDGDEDFSSDDSDDISSSSESASSYGSLHMTERGKQEMAKKELAYLSGAEDVSAVSEFGTSTSKSSVSGRRKKRKTRTCQKDVEDAGKFDLRNIIHGKRKRSMVDYKKLNADLFGDSIDLQAENTTDDDAEESANHYFPDDGDSESCTRHSSADNAKGHPDMSFKGLDRNKKCDKTLKTSDPAMEKPSRSMRRKPLINYRVLAGVIPSEEESESSNQGRECVTSVQKRSRQEGTDKKIMRASISKNQRKDVYSALHEINDNEAGKIFAKRVQKSMGAEKTKQEFKEKRKSFCTCKRSKCLKLYCICFSNERYVFDAYFHVFRVEFLTRSTQFTFAFFRLCVDRLCKCHDCGNRTAPGANDTVSSCAQAAEVARCPPHEILLALKMEEPMDEESCTNSPLQQSTSSTTGVDLPSLLLSLKTNDNPVKRRCSPRNNSHCTDASSSELAMKSSHILTALHPVASANVLESKFGNYSSDASKTSPIKNELPLRCSCRKSSCLKLYCYCYSQGSFCNQEWLVNS